MNPGPHPRYRNQLGLKALGLLAALAVALPLGIPRAVSAAPESTDGNGPAQSNVRRRALLVGISDYPDSLNLGDLGGPENDVQQLAQLLRDRVQFAEEDLLVLLGEAATRDAILEGFETHLIEPAHSEMIALFFFAGHGSQLYDTDGDEPDGLDETLVPYYIPSDDEDFPHIRDDELGKLFDQLGERTPHGCGIFDCCHSGTNTRGDRDPIFLPRRLPSPDPGRKATHPAPEVTDRLDHDHVFALDVNRLQRMPVILAACLDHQEALDVRYPQLPDFPAPRGIFSQSLEKSLRLLPPGTSYRSLFRWVRSEMRRLGQTYGFDQDPVLVCPTDRSVLGAEFSARTTEHVVRTLEDQGLVEINAGWLDGIHAGSIFEVRGPLQEGKRAGPYRALVETIDGPQYCRARILSSAASALDLTQLHLGSATFAEEASPDFACRLLLDLAPDLQQQLRETLQGIAYFDFASAKDWNLRVEGNEQQGFEVFDRSGKRWLPHPQVGAVREIDELAFDLEAWAIWRSVRSLANPRSPLQEQVKIEATYGWFEKPKGKAFQPEPPDRLSLGPEGEVIVRQRVFPQVSEGKFSPQQGIHLKVRNQTEKQLYLNVLSVTPTWRVRLTLPKTGWDFRKGILLGPGVEKSFSFSISLEQPTNWPDSLLLFVTDSPQDFSFVDSEGIHRRHRSSPSRNNEVLRSGLDIQGSLHQLLLQAYHTQGLRSAGPTAQPSTWMVHTIEWRMTPAGQE
jgi:hypothetical protein